ncbi:hypothetical protein QQ988_10600 [Staphylococcus epidermidis]|uniref:hypothetical protein n=1 Tax=Staphylococcus epidermidis TaxID=1282 RepID=UPI002570BB73|nr:hypothetical protein [Staphylococcus epidermidis]WJD66317.1 hypothetical protein QQ988_10600 [Staphylococcus epidermidis]
MAEDPRCVVYGSQVQKWIDDIQQLKQERDSFRKQRDELINDMAETKRKAEAFDEIVKIYDDVDNFTDSELMDAIEDKISDLERGSDVEI